MRSAISILIFASVTAGAHAHAHADDAYPTKLVDRAPYLPRGTSEVRFSLDALRHTVTEVDIDHATLELEARRRVGPVEPFVRASIVVERPRYAPYDRLGAIDAGVRVPVTCLSDVQVTVTSGEPTMRFITRYAVGATYEGRFWISPKLGVSGAIGATAAHLEIYRPPATPFDPIYHFVGNYELGLALLQLDLQASDNVAVSFGAKLQAEHDDAPFDSVTTDLYYHAQIFFAAPRFDVVARAMFRPEPFSTELTMTLGGAARF